MPSNCKYFKVVVLSEQEGFLERASVTLSLPEAVHETLYLVLLVVREVDGFVDKHLWIENARVSS